MPPGFDPSDPRFRELLDNIDWSTLGLEDIELLSNYLGNLPPGQVPVLGPGFFPAPGSPADIQSPSSVFGGPGDLGDEVYDRPDLLDGLIQPPPAAIDQWTTGRGAGGLEDLLGGVTPPPPEVSDPVKVVLGGGIGEAELRHAMDSFEFGPDIFRALLGSGMPIDAINRLTYPDIMPILEGRGLLFGNDLRLPFSEGFWGKDPYEKVTGLRSDVPPWLAPPTEVVEEDGDGVWEPPPVGEGPPPSAFESGLDDDFSGLWNWIMGDQEIDPLSVESLMTDPTVKSLMGQVDLEKKKAIEETTARLQQFGVLRGGDAIDLFGNLEGEFAQLKMDVLSDASERALTREFKNKELGVQFSDILSRREINVGELLGVLGGAKTLGGREADLGLLASVIAALDPEINIPREILYALIDTIFSGMGTGGFDPAAIASFRSVVQGKGPRPTKYPTLQAWLEDMGFKFTATADVASTSP